MTVNYLPARVLDTDATVDASMSLVEGGKISTRARLLDATAEPSRRPTGCSW